MMRPIVSPLPPRVDLRGVSMHIGKFQILGTLGSGAHSTILHIRRSADGKQYALKVVPLETKDRQIQV